MRVREIRGDEVERGELPNTDMEDTFDALEGAGDLEKRSLMQGHTKTPREIRGQDRVREAGLVFERDEAEALGGARTLANDGMARRADVGAVRDLLEPGSGKDAPIVETGAQVLHEMDPGGQSRQAIVRQGLLDRTQRRNRTLLRPRRVGVGGSGRRPGRGDGERSSGEEGSRITLERRHLPEGAAS